MKEEVANKLMEKALTYLNSAEAFMGENVPKYIEELLSFKVFEHLINVVSLTVLIALPVVLLEIFRRRTPKEDRDLDTTPYGPIMCFGWVITFFFTAFTIGSIKTELINTYKAYAAPRVYLVDYIKEGVK